MASAGNDWNVYCEMLYDVFRRDFIASSTTFQGAHVTASPKRTEKGKASTFWHIISEGREESDRLASFRRCECIGWPSPILGAAGTERVRWWRERRGRSRRVFVALPDFSYLVVLEELKSHCVLITAYPIERPHQRRNLASRYEGAAEKE
jgi:hypothetical protein